MPVKILFLISNFKAGGAERQFGYLIQHINREIFEVHLGLLLYRGSRPSAEYIKRLEGSRIHTFTREKRLDLSVVTDIARYVRKYHIDLIQTLLFMDNQIGRFTGLLARCPVVSSIRGEIRPLLGKRKSWFEYRMQMLSRFVVVNSDWLKKYVIRNGGREGKFVTIHNGIDPKHFQSDSTKKEMLEKFHLPDGKKILGIVARLHPMKDHVTFLDTLKAVMEREKDIHAVIAGDGELREDLENYAGRIGLKENVSFLGTVQDDLADLYRLMDVFLLTSQWGESFPNVILEAMSASVPVVASNISAIPEIITDGSNGFLVESRNPAMFADRVVQVLRDAKLKDSLVRNGQETVKGFSIPGMVRKYERLYLSLVDNSRTACDSVLKDHPS